MNNKKPLPKSLIEHATDEQLHSSKELLAALIEARITYFVANPDYYREEKLNIFDELREAFEIYETYRGELERREAFDNLS